MFDVSKVLQIILFFAKKENNVENVKYIKILKLLFLADKLYLKKYWTTISGDSYVAMKLWPVASHTLNVIKEPERFWELEEEIGETIRVNLDDKTITALKDVDYDYFSQLELETLEKIYEVFWGLKWGELVDICHGYNEWAKHKDAIWSSSIPMDFLDFFTETQGENEIFEMTEDEVALARDIYQEKLAYA